MADNDKKKTEDFKDLQAELIGDPTGKQARFITGANSPMAKAKEAKERNRAIQSALDRLLMDPLYRAAYDRACHTLDDTQAKLDAAMMRTHAAIERLTQLKDDLESKAGHMADGTAVFRAADGSVWTADGRRLSDADSASLHIPLDAPSYEQYKGACDARDSARARQKRLGEIQTEIVDPAREKLHDKEHPQRIEGVKSIEGELQHAKNDIDKAEHAKTEFNPKASPKAPDVVSKSNLDLSAPAP